MWGRPVVSSVTSTITSPRAACRVTLGVDPIWLGVAVGINLQTSFLTPPFGFSLFYLRGVAPGSVSTGMIYKGVVPFVILQLIGLGILFLMPALATWLPGILYN
jgi:TRAP-type mannitol/chloroaromatic compound transport system permease large subunit